MTPANANTHAIDLGPRDQILTDMGNDRRAWRLTELPQIVILAILLIALAVIAVMGMASAIISLKTMTNTKDFVKVLQLFVGGTSSILGFAVLKLSVRISEMTKRYLQEEKHFTSDMNRIRLCKTTSEMELLLKQYYKPAR